MPIPPKQEEKEKGPGLFSWQSLLFLGLIGTAASSLIVRNGRFQMNRNLNVMERFVTQHSSKFGKLVEHTPSSKHKIFHENVLNIVETANKIANDKDTKHSYPRPTFPLQTTIVGKKRTLVSTIGKPENEKHRNGNTQDENDRNVQG